MNECVGVSDSPGEASRIRQWRPQFLLREKEKALFFTVVWSSWKIFEAGTIEVTRIKQEESPASCPP